MLVKCCLFHGHWIVVSVTVYVVGHQSEEEEQNVSVVVSEYHNWSCYRIVWLGKQFGSWVIFQIYVPLYSNRSW